MIKSVITLVAILGSTTAFAACPSYLDHSMRKLHSKEDVNFCQAFGDKPMLIVNTASHCGYTPQFKGLEALYNKYRDKGLVVVGFASDDFRQEARDEASAAEVCYVNYGVTFTMVAPSHVKGADANPVFQALNSQSQPPGWNFNKYLVDASGKVVRHFGSNTKPDSKVLEAAIESVL
ncbi:MAG: glutathione peroxidase [Halioglobus sp.]|jgi:glutathione peroxidase